MLYRYNAAGHHKLSSHGLVVASHFLLLEVQCSVIDIVATQEESRSHDHKSNPRKLSPHITDNRESKAVKKTLAHQYDAEKTMCDL